MDNEFVTTPRRVSTGRASECGYCDPCSARWIDRILASTSPWQHESCQRARLDAASRGRLARAHENSCDDERSEQPHGERTARGSEQWSMRNGSARVRTVMVIG